MRILLLNPFYRPQFLRNARWATVGISGSNWYPIYLAYCTGLLEREGFFPKLLDAQNRGLSNEATCQIARDFKPELLVLYFSTPSEKSDLMVGEKIRELTRCEVVMVGPWASIHPERTLRDGPGIRFLAEGEFDFTVLDLARGIEPRNIPGLHWKTAFGEIVANGPRPPVPAEELDKFPFVTDVYHRHLNIQDYRQTGHRYPLIDLFTGRGCAWGRCGFCLWPFTINKGAGYRKRSMDNVIEELRFIRTRLPFVREIFIQDDVLPGDRALELSEAILRANVKMVWSCYSRANLDLKTMQLMKRSGCRTLHVGYESASPEILKKICKGVSPERMLKFTKEARRAGLFIVADFITGLPGETVQTVKQTAAWAKRLPVHRYTITLPKPYPKTPLYQMLEEKGHLKDGYPSYPWLPYEEIRMWNKWILRKVYFNPRYLIRMMRYPVEWLRLARSAFFFLPYLFKRHHPYQ
jgi:radical SAM superfamily enzyme YgiQ (UPF0313 family)